MIITDKKRAALISKWKERPISWSQLYSWKYSKDQWAFKYLFGMDDEGNQGMHFGTTVGDTLGLPNSMVPALNPHLVGIKEFELHAKMNGMTLIGYADHYCPDTKVLNENKTSQNINRWDQKAVHEHGQLTMYALMLLLTHKVPPEKIKMYLNFIPVVEGQDFEMRVLNPEKFFRFQTDRTLQQVLQFGADIGTTIKAMEKYAMTVDAPLDFFA